MSQLQLSTLTGRTSILVVVENLARDGLTLDQTDAVVGVEGTSQRAVVVRSLERKALSGETV